MAIQIVILAAGQGKRMVSDSPKIMHPLAGKPLLQHVIDVALKISPNKKPIVVYGHQGKVVQDAFASAPVTFVLQPQQLGTGNAVMCALNHIDASDQVLILSGDVPLITEETLQRFIAAVPADTVGILTATLTDAKGYGRIVRDKKNQIIRIVEEKDAGTAEVLIKEINTGIYLVPARYLQTWLPTLTNSNNQNEYYLTDIIALAVANHVAIHDAAPTFVEEIFGVNDRIQLATLERFYQRQLAHHYMRQGVTIIDPDRFDVRGSLQVGRDVVIDVNVVFTGQVVVGDDCVIGPNCFIRNTKLDARVKVHANSYLDGAEIATDSVIGPFARLRPGTVLEREVHIGNFVEVKNSTVREASKINHLSYIGDSDIGKFVNIGAGTITCNYDGAKKHKTQIGDHVHIGSGTKLIAPVSVGNNATIGAGSTIIKDAPANQLTLTQRLEQRSINWSRPGEPSK